MKNIIKSGVFVLIFLSFEYSCKDIESTMKYDVQQHIKDWMYFDTGSWWLYKEVNTGILDSQFVTESKSYYLNNEGNNKSNPNLTVQLIEVHINSDYYIKLSSPFGGSSIVKISKKSSERLSTYLRYDPLRIGERKNTGIGHTEITALDPKFKFGNTTDTLVTFFDNIDMTEQNDSVEYKVLKGVGIINKRNISKNQNWQLIKHNIKMNKN